MKKMLAVFLVCCIMVSCLVGCGSQAQQADTQQAAAETKAAETKTAETKAAETVAAEEPLEIQWMVQNTINVPFDSECESDLKDYLEEKYNIKIVLQQVDVHDLDSLGLYWAGGGDPDVITGTWQVWNTWANLIDEGLIRDIPDGYLETYMPDWMDGIYQQLGEENVKKQCTVDGKTYIVAGNRDTVPYVMTVRKDWLDNLGITELPTTLDELYDLAYKFTYEDPDKNGVNDTYGFGYSYAAGYLGNYFDFVIGYTLNDDGSVTYNGASENMKDFLKEAKRWYDAGIIDPEIGHSGDDQYNRDAFVSGRYGIHIDNMNYSTTDQANSVINRLREIDPNAEVVVIPPLKDQNGKQTAECTTRVGTQSGALAFGANCTDEKMIRIMQIKNDLAKDFEFYKRCKYGVEGVHYKIENGKIITLDVADADKDPLVGGAFAQGTPFKSEWLSMIYSDEKADLYNKYTNSAMENWLQISQNFSLLKSNESAKLYATDCGTLTDEFIANAIMGKIDIDSEWEGYLAELQNRHLKEITDEYEELLK